MRHVISVCSRVGLLLALLLAGGVANAGGPQYVDANGRPYIWDPARTTFYTMDPGPLGRFSNAQVTAWVANAFRTYASVPGVTLNAQPTSPFSEDIDGDNVLDIYDTLAPGVNLIILDSDGGVLDTLFGYGTSEEVDGTSGAMFYLFGGQAGLDVANARLTQMFTILNGLTSAIHSPEYEQGGLIEHEIGHFLGLCHSQINPRVLFDGDPTNDHLAPRMSYNDGPNSRPGLHVDDRAWILRLYPTGDAPATTGTIRGHVFLPDGKTGFQGAQVVARRDGDEEVTAVSVVSGFEYKSNQGLGSRDVALQGLYELPGLPPGNYRIAIEQLDEYPIVPPRHTFLPGGRRFYHESGRLVAQRQEATLLSVSAGQVIDGKDFVLDGPARTVQEAREIEPNGNLEMAQTLVLPAAVTGGVSLQDFRFWSILLPGRRRDLVEDWYRVVVTEPTILSATLTATSPTADLNLYLVTDSIGVGFIGVWDLSIDTRTPPETFQVRVTPGVYFVGVSANDATGSTASDYRLTVVDTPAVAPAAATPNAPKITLAVVSNVTPTGMRVSWQTDQDANSVLYVGDPARELGVPALARDRTFDVTGLAAATDYTLEIFSRGESTEMDVFTPLLVNTSLTTSGGTPYVSGGLWSAVPQDEKNREFLLIAHISNSGHGAASHVRLNRMALPAGWQYDRAPVLPLDLGQLGRGAFAVIGARVTRTADNAAPLDLILQGDYVGIDGAVRDFGR